MKPRSLVVKYASASLFGGQIDVQEFFNLRPEEQKEVLSFAAGQGVICPFVNALYLLEADFDLSYELYSWLGMVFQSENDYKLRIETMKQIARLFSNEGIDVMFLKGATLAEYYPYPMWRTWSDIDYYVYGRSDDCIRLLESVGAKTSCYYHHHTQCSLNGILLENHYDFFDRHNHKCNCVLDDFMKELARTEGQSFPFCFENALDIRNSYMMSPTMDAIFLVRHMSAHFVSETVTLRQLYDFALFLKADGNKVDWKKVIDMYRISGMMRFSQIIVAIVTNKLGVDLSTNECPIPPEEGIMTEKVWQSILFSDGFNPYKRYGFRYMAYEFRTFFKNRWKHMLVYHNEPYIKLFFIYSLSHIRRMLVGNTSFSSAFCRMSSGGRYGKVFSSDCKSH